MKNYNKPQLKIINMISSESFAFTPWNNFSSLEEFGNISSYNYGSGVQL